MANRYCVHHQEPKAPLNPRVKWITAADHKAAAQEYLQRDDPNNTLPDNALVFALDSPSGNQQVFKVSDLRKAGASHA